MAAHPCCTVSPTEGVTSAHKILPRQYSKLFEDEETANLDDLFRDQNTTGIGSCPRGLADKLKRALVKSRSERSMNAAIQDLLNKSFAGNGNLIATDGSVTEKTLSTMFAHANGLPISMGSRPRFLFA